MHSVVKHMPSWILAIGLLAGAAHGAGDPAAAARSHFKSGGVAFDERRFGDALAEYEKAYALHPNYTILYNLGMVHVALGHPVEAADALSKYLTQGGRSIDAGRRHAVEEEIARQQARVGELVVGVSPAEAEVRVDGRVVGKAPLAGPLRVSAGKHAVEAARDGYRAERREIEVKGQGRVELSLQLQELAAPASPVASAAPTPAAAPVSPPAEKDATPVAARDAGASASSGGSTQRAVGYTLGALGLVGAGVGVGFAVSGQSKHEDALKQFAAGETARAEETEADSQDQKKMGYVVLGAGSALVVGGVVLLLTAPSDKPASSAMVFTPWVTGRAGGASVVGIW